jgi:hypothetical protein
MLVVPIACGGADAVVPQAEAGPGYGADAAGSNTEPDAHSALDGSSASDAGSGFDALRAPDGPLVADASGVLDASATPDALGATDATGTTTDGGFALPSPLYGVTVDDISGLSDIVASLGALPHKPTTRIVFDEGEAPSYYAQAVKSIGAVSYVMGEILDSQFVSNVSITAYTQRTTDYLSAFPTGVDLWEVGNEINGNWLGATSDVVTKMTNAYTLVKNAGGKAELTLYGCSDSDPSYDMITWAKAHIQPDMARGFDYVLVSYYEGDCASPRADSEWPGLFQQLRNFFPNAGIGFGEVGAVDLMGQDVNSTSIATPYLQKYNGMNIPVSGYVGGYFWWFFREDMVPKTLPLFPVLSAAMK